MVQRVLPMQGRHPVSESNSVADVATCQMTRIYPDLKWYAAQSTERGVPIRCPHANAYSCPRYYQSLALLGEAHIATAIDPKKDEELLAKWKASPLWPLVDEHATSIVNASMFANFCPEVAFDRFGLFATYLARYADEIDREQAERQLVESGVSPTDWAWNWQSAREMHYTD